MPRTNKSKYALLVLLSLGPRSGYDIKGDIKRSIGHFWNESFGQIYPALRAIVAEGLATVHEEPQQGKPNRKVYTITRQGKTALRQWLETPPEPPPVRNEMLLKLFVGWQAPHDTLKAHVSGLLEHFSQQLAQFAVYERILEEQARENPDVLYWFMTIRSGQLYTQARVQWCKETLSLLATAEEAQESSGLGTAARTKQMSGLMTLAQEAVQAAYKGTLEQEEMP
jgi:DNA-binding PadR family transcriptional regulator